MVSRYTIIILVLFLSLKAFGQNAREQSQIDAFPTYGLLVTRPIGAQKLMPNVPSHISTYGFLPGSPQANCKILIEINKLQPGSNIQSMAEQLVKKVHAKIISTTEMIDALPTICLRAPYELGEIKSRTTYLVERGKYVYRFSALDTDKTSVIDALKSLISSAKWVPVESPTLHIQDLNMQASTLCSACTFQGPTCMVPIQTSAKYCKYGIYDLNFNDFAFFIDAYLIQSEHNYSFDQIKGIVAERIMSDCKLSESIKWTRHSELSNLFTSQELIAPVTLPNGQKEQLTSRYCYLDLGKGRFLYICFAIPMVSAVDTKAYLPLIDKMLNTLKTTE